MAWSVSGPTHFGFPRRDFTLLQCYGTQGRKGFSKTSRHAGHEGLKERSEGRCSGRDEL